MFAANCLIISKFMIAKWQSRQGGTESVNQALSKSATKGSAMLLTVSFAFIILTSPIGITQFAIYGTSHPQLFFGITVILQYLNHSIKMEYLYAVSVRLASRITFLTGTKEFIFISGVVEQRELW